MSGLPERIHKPGAIGDTYFMREFIEQKMRPSLKPDTVLGWYTEDGDFELNPEVFHQPKHRKVEYRREAIGSDWFVRVEAPSPADQDGDGA